MIAIDPGPERSAFVIAHNAKISHVPSIISREIWSNDDVVSWLRDLDHLRTGPLIIERVESYGAPVGEETFSTCVWIGRFIEAWGNEFHLIGRREVKARLCPGVRNPGDPVIRQRLIDLYGPGKEIAIGTKANPGPLHGVKKDIWAALAVAVAWHIGPAVPAGAG